MRWFFLHALFLFHQPVKSQPVSNQLPRRPFPQHVAYSPGILIPDHVGRTPLDDSVRSFYSAWKERYIRKGCQEGEYYVWFEERGAKQCVSEGQGYGMLIVALMAGSDTAAKTIYDGLFRYCRSHPSGKDPLLMAWAQTSGCRDIDRGTATDGDMDIAYSLLLAGAQWGTRGSIAYADEGRRMIASILGHDRAWVRQPGMAQ
jgi:endoglucanase